MVEQSQIASPMQLLPTWRALARSCAGQQVFSLYGRKIKITLCCTVKVDLLLNTARPRPRGRIARYQIANILSQAIAASMRETNNILTARHSEHIYNFGTKADPSAQSPTAVTRAFGVQAPPKLVGLAVTVAVTVTWMPPLELIRTCDCGRLDSSSLKTCWFGRRHCELHMSC